MKLAIFLTLGLAFQAFAEVNAQKITLKVTNAPLREVVQEIQKQLGYSFLFRGDEIADMRVGVQLKEADFDDAMGIILKKQRLGWSLDEGIVTIFRMPSSSLDESSRTQQRALSGRVTDSQGAPLPGVTVVVKGTTLGTVTNSDGEYSLTDVPDSVTLVFSSVGMRTQEVWVDNQSTISITMEEDAIGIDEVVAIGYGTVKKSDLTGAVQRVNVDNFRNQRSTNIVEVLSGTIAGVNSNQGTSASGGGSLEIRGPNSLKASTSPLIILDGAVYMGALTDIHPADIESIDVLKDASAAAIYGAQSASGVLIITTKRGQQGEPTLGFSATVGVAGLTNNNIRPFSPEAYLSAREVNLRQTNLDRPEHYFTNPNKLPEGVSVDEWVSYGTGAGDPTEIWLNRLTLNPTETENYLAGNTIDWYDEIFRNGIQQDYNVSMAGGTSDLQYFLSAGYTGNEGYTVGDEYTNFRSRVNIDGNITSFLKVGVNAQFANRDNSSVSASRTGAVRISPYGSKYNEDGTLRMYPMEDIFVNPLIYPSLRDYFDNTQTLFAIIFGEVELPWGISYRINYSNNMSWRKEYLFDPFDTPRGTTNDGYGSRMSRSTHGWQVDNILKWNQTFGEIHDLDVTFVANAEKRQTWQESQTNTQFSPNDNLGYHAMQMGSVPNINSDDTYQTGSALMGRINYSLLNKYLFTFTTRKDGYSAFGSRHPYATFPSAAFAWRVSDERFFKTSLINDLKLRLSWGETGNRSIGIYEALARLQLNRYIYGDNLEAGVWSSRMANEDLRWESTAALNLGIDFGLFQNRLSGSIDLFDMTTTNLLLDRSLPSIMGYSSVAANLGELENKGMEVTLSSTNVDIQDKFRWNTTLNFSLNRNKIKSLYGDMIDVVDGAGNVTGQKEADDWTNGWFIGESIDRIWDYEAIGVWQIEEADKAAMYGKTPGDYKLRDINDDGVLTPEDDKVFLGYSRPRYRLGLRNDFNFLKGFNLSIFLRADLGFYRSNPLYAADSGHEASEFYIYRTNILARPYWTEENPTNEWAKLRSNLGAPSFSIYKNSSFLRIQDVSLSYNFPAEKIRNYSLQHLRLFINLRNYFTLTKWNYWDPESGGAPMPKYFNFGLSVNM